MTPLGVLGVMPDPHLYPVHMFTSVIGAPLSKMTEFVSTYTVGTQKLGIS